MMITLLLRVLPLCLAIVGVLVGLVVSVAQAEPLSDQPLEGLTICHVPCWIGIEPGRTAFAEVPAIVSRQFPARRWQVRGTRSYLVLPSLESNTVTVDEHNNMVNSIQMKVRLPLWRLLLLFGKPVCYQRFGDPGLINIHWNVNGIYVLSHFAAADWNPEWRSNALVLMARSSDPCERLLPWRGLALLKRS